MILKPGLYIVSTPIGNLEDITIRAISILKNSHIILCEDSRTSRKLLEKHGVNTKLQVYNDHSNQESRDYIISLIKRGKIISIISDAGTPLISDPGYKLVQNLRDLNLHIEAVPGVTAPIVALTLSGLPTDRFIFSGFLPKTLSAKKRIFQEHINIPATLIFFETALRLIESLIIAQDILGNRTICVARELTKRYQEIKTGYINEIIEFYKQNPLKGEIVLLISGNPPEKTTKTLENELRSFVKPLLSKDLSSRSITDIAYEKFKSCYSKNTIYKMVVEALLTSER